MSARFLDRSSPPHIVTLVLVAGVSALNLNIFLPSLPGIGLHFKADYVVVQLAISAYLAGTALLQIVIGPLSDRFGRRPVMIWSLVIFLAASVLCTFAPTIEIFLIGRMLQTTVVAGFVLSRAIVRDMVPIAEAASMIGYVTMGMALVPMIGPIIGGILDEFFGWQASFAVLIGFGILTLIIVWVDQGETNLNRTANFASQFRAYPELLSSRRFWGYTLTAAFASGAFFAFLGGGPWVATNVLGLSPSELGLWFMVIAIGYMAGNYISGRYSTRIGINRMMLSGNLICATGMAGAVALFSVGFVSPATFFGTIFFVGFGNGMTLPSANAGIVSVRPQLAGSASGLGGAMMIGGGAGLSALAGALLSPGSTGIPLLVLMAVSAFAGIAATLYVIYVEFTLTAQ